MAPVTRKRKQEDAVSSQGEQAPSKITSPTTAAMQPLAKSAKRARGSRKQHGLKIADEGRDSSRSFFASANKGLGSQGIKEAKKEVRRMASELAQFVDKELLESSTRNGQADDLESLPPGLASFVPAMISSASENGNETKNPTYAKAKACLDSFGEAIRGYERLNSGCNDITKPTWVRWDQDCKDLRTLDRHALGASFKALSKVVMPQDKPMVEGPAPKADDIEAMARELVAEANPRPGEDTWGTAAKALLTAICEAVEKMAKGQERRETERG